MLAGTAECPEIFRHNANEAAPRKEAFLEAISKPWPILRASNDGALPFAAVG